MTSFRTIGLIGVAFAAALVLLFAAYLLWNARQFNSLPVRPLSTVADIDVRSHLLLDQVELLGRRVADMQTLVLILLAASGLYTIVFVIAAHFSALSFSRQADWYVTNIKDQLGLAMGDLRELKEETQQTLREETKQAGAQMARIQEEVRAAVQDLRAEAPSGLPLAGIAQNLAAIQNRILALSTVEWNEDEGLEIVYYESAIAVLDVAGGQELKTELARAHRAFAELYARRDPARTRFHLRRALSLTPAESPAASEIHYELACFLASLGEKKRSERTRHFEHALEALRVAFQHPSRVLDDKLAADIEEGGCLYLLASTQPFDRAINDLLLNMSIGAG